MSEKAAERMVEDDANSAAVDAWRHPVEPIPEDLTGEPQVNPSEHVADKEPGGTRGSGSKKG